MGKKFKIEGGQFDKQLQVSGFDNLAVFVDFDDVDHVAVKKDIKKLTALLEKYWKE